MHQEIDNISSMFVLAEFVFSKSPFMKLVGVESVLHRILTDSVPRTQFSNMHLGPYAIVYFAANRQLQSIPRKVASATADYRIYLAEIIAEAERHERALSTKRHCAGDFVPYGGAVQPV